jgi:hypothetical protein
MIVNNLPDSFLLMMSGYLPAPPLGCLSNTCTWCHYVVHIPLWQLRPVPFGSGLQTYLGTTSFSLLRAANTRFHSWTFPKVLPIIVIHQLQSLQDSATHHLPRKAGHCANVCLPQLPTTMGHHNKEVPDNPPPRNSNRWKRMVGPLLLP